MATRVNLLCHASTMAVRAADFPADEPLDPHSLRKTAEVEHTLRHPDRAWTGPALRARQTAAQLKLDATVEPLLRDWDFGDWTGRSLADVQNQDPDAAANWMSDPAFAPGGGESLLDVIGRVAVWLEAQTARAGQVVAMTHASVIRAAIITATASPPGSFWHLSIAPLSLTRLSYASGRWTLVSLGPLAEMAIERPR